MRQSGAKRWGTPILVVQGDACGLGLGAATMSTLMAGVIANGEGISWATKDKVQQANYFGSLTKASTIRVGSYNGEETYAPFKSLLPMEQIWSEAAHIYGHPRALARQWRHHELHQPVSMYGSCAFSVSSISSHGVYICSIEEFLMFVWLCLISRGLLRRGVSI